MGASLFRGLHRLTEVDQHGTVLEIVRVGQGEVMGRHRPDRVLIQEVAQDAAGRDLPLGGVRPLQNLIEEVEDRPFAGRARRIANRL